MKLGPNLKYGSLMALVVFAVSALGLYGGAVLVHVDKPEELAVDEDIEPGGPVAVTIIGKDSRFDRRSFTAAAGGQVTVTFDNQDAGLLHNIHFYTNNRATTPIPGSDSGVRPGPAIDVITFTAPTTPGNAFYRCDVHPDTMTGTMVVR